MVRKYLISILKFKDIADTYKEENGSDKPWYLSRRFIGTVIAIIAGVLFASQGIVISETQIQIIIDGFITIIPVLVSLYGIIMGVVGQIKKKK